MSINFSLIICPNRFHRTDDVHRLHADRADPLHEVGDLFLVIGKAVGVELFADCRVFGLALLVVFEDPLDCGTVAEPRKPFMEDVFRYTAFPL